MQRAIVPGSKLIWIKRANRKFKCHEMIPVTVIYVKKWARVKVEETGSIRNVDPDNLKAVE